ncbi:MAG TPA: aryl-sulfate sulfotransferase [Gemmataceae bacterium]|nr:aryl-sulfate sulfotransferase [Gemmataceae bacterium]
MKPLFGMVALVAMLFVVDLGFGQGPGQPGKGDPKQKDAQPPQPGKVKAALVLNAPGAFKGYTLFSPMSSNKSYLIDMDGRVVHSWQGSSSPAMSAYLLPNGNLFRPATGGPGGKGKGGIAGAGGRLQEIAWDGTIVWDYLFDTDKYMPHHDAIKLPNGNYLAIVSISKSAEEASAAGRRGGAVMADSLLEIKPRGKDGGDIVWQWNTWDHLIQDADAAKPNYGKIAENPGLLDINFGGGGFGKGDPGKGKGDFKGKDKGDPGKGDPKGKDKGKIGPGLGGKGVDWNHCNGLAYNAELDQIIISVHSFSEFWIIDHSTTTAEAATHKGGKQGKGGDLLYRWGNPSAYGAGKAGDRTLFMQHNAHWIPTGLPGAGHILVFNNGPNRPEGTYSSVDEIIPPVDAKGGYEYKPGVPYGPAKAAWSYTADKKGDFFAQNISGAQRLPNGNTLICSGPSGIIFEVTPKNEVVWKYVNPGGGGPGAKGPPGGDKKGDFKKGDPKAFDPKGGEPKKDIFIQPGKGGPGGGGGGLFRATRIAPEHPALVGKTLTPGSTLEELLQGKGK